LQEQIKDKDEVILEYFIGEDNIYLFTISSAGLELLNLGNASDITNDILDLQNIFQSEQLNINPQKEYNTFCNAAYKLCEFLFTPFESTSSHKYSKLTIIPDGELNYIPFEVLLKGKSHSKGYGLDQLDYLIEDYNISYHYSSWLYNNELSDKKANQPIKSILSFAPVFNKNNELLACNDLKLSKLSCSKEEVEKINQHVSGKIFVDNKATKEEFMQEASSYKILHLATHACVDKFIYRNGSPKCL